MKSEYVELIVHVEETQILPNGEASSLQGKLVKLLWRIYNEACEHGNIHASEALQKDTEFIQDTLLETDLFNFEERVDLRDRLDAISETLRIAMLADEWGREAFDEANEDPTEVAIPVLVADDFYTPLFDALGIFIEANPEPIALKIE